MNDNFNRAEFDVLQNSGNLMRDFSDLLFFAVGSRIRRHKNTPANCAVKNNFTAYVEAGLISINQ
jgi:hypothetical protein